MNNFLGRLARFPLVRLGYLKTIVSMHFSHLIILALKVPESGASPSVARISVCRCDRQIPIVSGKVGTEHTFVIAFRKTKHESELLGK